MDGGMMTTLKVTPSKTAGEWEFFEERHCPGCGHRGVWCETGPGDYYVGPTYACTSCSQSGVMWDTSTNSVPAEVFAALKAAEPAP